MKLLELAPALKGYTRIRRPNWDCFLVKSYLTNSPLILCDFYSLQLKEYLFTYEDLIADDWEILND